MKITKELVFIIIIGIITGTVFTSAYWIVWGKDSFQEKDFQVECAEKFAQQICDNNGKSFSSASLYPLVAFCSGQFGQNHEYAINKQIVLDCVAQKQNQTK